MGQDVQDPFMFDEQDGVQLWSVPQPSPVEGLNATILRIKAVDDSHTIVSFGSLFIDGPLVQVWNGTSK